MRKCRGALVNHDSDVATPDICQSGFDVTMECHGTDAGGTGDFYAHGTAQGFDEWRNVLKRDAPNYVPIAGSFPNPIMA